MHLSSLNFKGIRKLEKIEHLLANSKCDILTLQETRWHPNNFKHIEKLWSGPCFFSSGSSASAGLAVFFREGLCKTINLIHSDIAGRLMVIDICTDALQQRLINIIYAPNSEKERKTFFTGDFNTTLSKHDISVNNTYRAEISRNILPSIMKNNNLIDIWRTLNPRKRQFSRRQLVEGKLKQSRIDLCLVAAMLIRKISSINTRNSWSDHDFLNVHLNINKLQRNGGLWCLKDAEG